MRKFWFHYNKPASKKASKPQITLHYKDQCMLVDNVVLNVKTFGQVRKRQPYFVVCGYAESVLIKNKIAHVN